MALESLRVRIKARRDRMLFRAPPSPLLNRVAAAPAPGPDRPGFGRGSGPGRGARCGCALAAADEPRPAVDAVGRLPAAGGGGVRFAAPPRRHPQGHTAAAL